MALVRVPFYFINLCLTVTDSHFVHIYTTYTHTHTHTHTPIAHRHRYMCEERANASVSDEDKRVTPWVNRDGYKIRWRNYYGGMVCEPEVQYDGDPTIYGSPEEQNKVLEMQVMM